MRRFTKPNVPAETVLKRSEHLKRLDQFGQPLCWRPNLLSQAPNPFVTATPKAPAAIAAEGDGTVTGQSRHGNW